MLALPHSGRAHARIPFAAFAFAIACAIPASVPAATFTPDVFVDMQEDPSDGYLSLREAVKKANATTVKDVIKLKAGNFALTAGSPPGGKSAYWAGDGRLKITKDLFFRLVTDFPDMGIEIMRSLAHRVEQTTAQLREARAANPPS